MRLNVIHPAAVAFFKVLNVYLLRDFVRVVAAINIKLIVGEVVDESTGELP